MLIPHPYEWDWLDELMLWAFRIAAWVFVALDVFKGLCWFVGKVLDSEFTLTIVRKVMK